VTWSQTAIGHHAAPLARQTGDDQPGNKGNGGLL